MGFAVVSRHFARNLASRVSGNRCGNQQTTLVRIEEEHSAVASALTLFETSSQKVVGILIAGPWNVRSRV